MSRLTKRVRSDVSPMILKLLNLEEVPDECVEVIGTDSKTCDEVCEENQCSSCVLSAVFEKLAHYEDLEEQGRLIVVQEDVLVEIYNLVHDVGPAEIAEQIRADNLNSWSNRWRASIKAKLAELKGTEE